MNTAQGDHVHEWQANSTVTVDDVAYSPVSAMSETLNSDLPRDPFANDVLERLIRSNQDYQRSHGHYIVPLAERLLAARREIADLKEAVRAHRV